MESTSRRVPAWDFGAAKGTGASVVMYDPDADLTTRRYTPEILAIPERKPPLVPEKPKKTPEHVFIELDVSKLDALKLAYQLIAEDDLRHRAIVQDLRAAVAKVILRVGGSRALADAVLHGLHDVRLATLLPETRTR
jgi:hypothetical protein